MAITVTLTVETGSGLSDANSYASIAQFRAWWAQQNVDYTDNTKPGQSDNAISAALIRATEYIDGMHFFGERKSVTQALSFPRVSLTRPGSSHIWPSYLSDSEVPAAIVSAVCYMAGMIVQGKDIDAPTQRVSSQSVSGVGSVSYSDGSGKVSYPRLNTLLKGLINPAIRAEVVL